MSKELLLLLKRAGFKAFWPLWLIEPSLEELMSACGPGFAGVVLYSDGTKQWIARDDATGMCRDSGTLKGAVANLWLALKSAGHI